MSQVIFPNEEDIYIDIGEWLDKHYAKWIAYLGKKEDRPIYSNHNTRVRLWNTLGKEAYIAIKLHGTDILDIKRDSITYRCNGYFTQVTKHRLNHYGPLLVWQEQKRWWYGDPHSGMRQRFVDGMTFNRQGVRIDKLTEPDWEEEDV